MVNTNAIARILTFDAVFKHDAKEYNGVACRKRTMQREMGTNVY